MSLIETAVIEPRVSRDVIWDEDGELVSLVPAPKVEERADVAVIIVNRNRPDLVDAMMEQLASMGRGLSVDHYVIEMGSDADKRSRHCTFWYPDDDFRGKCYGHNVGLRLARSRKQYRYYWILMNDVVFQEGVDALATLVEIADRNPRLAVMSAAEPEANYANCKPKPDVDYHLVSTCDYLDLLVRAESVDEAGFLNPDFRYCWGAIHELSYKLHSRGWRMAYCDRVTKKHLGGTTYGAAKNTISRSDYQRRAKEFAARYFAEHYGKDWDEEFSRHLPPEVEINTFPIHRQHLESVLDEREVRTYHLPSLEARQGRTELERQIELLHPWYYELEVGGVRVTPGIGACESTAELRARNAYQTKLLVDEVVKRYDFRGRRLLDIASNCGYWSSHYARHGATSLLAVEGRLTYVRQGRLYWGSNDFVQPGAFEFFHANVVKPETWQYVQAAGPFDFSLCCGILYHIADHERLLRRIAAVTKEAVLIDTRVDDAEEIIEEPGGWCFDSIVETRRKRNPSLSRMVELMSELGFRTVRLTTDVPMPASLRGNEDYSTGRRVALLAFRGG